jgi:hypothetical protein
MRRTHRLAPLNTARQVEDCGKTPSRHSSKKLYVRWAWQPKDGRSPRAALAVRRQEDQASVARPYRKFCNPPQQSFGAGRLGTRADLRGARAQAVDVARRDACRHKAPAHFMGRIVEHRLRIIAGGEHHLPAPGGARRARLCDTVADERAKDWHEAGEPDKSPQRHRTDPLKKHPQHGAVCRAILAKIEEITRCQ